MTESDWTIEQTVRLFALCDQARNEGRSLSWAFETMAESMSRSVNSVRNYYYGQAKTFELVPEVAKTLGIGVGAINRKRFVPFSAGDAEKLVEKILIAKGRGISVRAAIAELSGGDAKLALRYQNKYRSILRSHRDLVERIVKDLAERHMPYSDPYAKESGNNFARLTEYIAALDEKRVGRFLSIIEKLM